MGKLEILQNESLNNYRVVSQFLFGILDVSLYILHYFIEVLQVMGATRCR
jgi:hypothetical protein